MIHVRFVTPDGAVMSFGDQSAPITLELHSWSVFSAALRSNRAIELIHFARGESAEAGPATKVASPSLRSRFDSAA